MTIPPVAPLPGTPLHSATHVRHGADAGETLVVPERMIVQPVVGIFRSNGVADGMELHAGDEIGVVEGPGTSCPILSPFGGTLMGMLAHPGERLRSGQPIAWLRVAVSVGNLAGLPISIVGWGTTLPDGRCSNAELESRLDTNDAWIVERTGIRERRVAAPGETASTLGIAAAADAIKRAGLTPSDIDFLVVATATPDQRMPHTGAFVSEALGLCCPSFDLTAASAGFVYELVVGASMLNAGYDHVLIVGSETMTTITDPDDRGTAILFGDGAAAAVLARSESAPGLLAWDLGCDGSAAGLIEIPAGGQYMQMQGQEVFRRAVRAISDSSAVTLERAGVAVSDVAWFVPHQANLRIIEAAAKRLGFAAEQVVTNIERYGNTSAASIPLAWFEAVEDGRVQPGDLVLCSGVGAGLTWGSTLVRWGPS